MNRSVYHTAMKIACSIYFALLFSFNSALSQESDLSQQPEKIYLQLDGKVYTTNQTIWFKAIVTDIDHAPTLLSGVLHVELIGADKVVVDNKLLKLENGTGSGEFELTENYKTGRYLIRAYTEWNKNFGEDFIFQEYVDVFPSSASATQPIDNLFVDKKDSAKHRLSATLNPFVLDSLHRGNVNVYLTLDGKKDSLGVRKNDQGSYVLDYELPLASHVVTISIRTANAERFTMTFSVNTEDIDLQFFPEGGELIHGLASKVGFKALDYSGKGKMVEGVIADAEGHVIANFKSNELGMGSFFLRADSSKGYHAVLKDHPEKYPLPHVKSKGWVVNIRKPGGNFTIAVASSVQQMDSVYIRLSCRDKEYQILKGSMDHGGLLATPDIQLLPEGVITITILDKNMRPVAERLVFNERQDTRADLRLHADKNVYVQREKTSVTVKVNDIGEKEKADLSMLVINKEQMGSVQSMRENILSYFLLSSDLKGEIENPGYYFRKENANRLTDLDALLLTQGWRKFLYQELTAGDLHFQPEYNLSISGSVGGVLSKKNKKEGIALTLMTFKEPVFVKSQTTDSLGRFHFDIPDRYDERLNFTVQSANQKGENKDYQVLLDEKITPSISYRQSPEMIDSVVSLLLEKHRERKLIEDAYRLSDVNYLDEVKIKATRIIPEREKVTEMYGEPDIVIDGDAIRAKEQKWSFGLYSVLMHYFPEEVKVRKIDNYYIIEGMKAAAINNNNFLYANIIGWEPTIVVIDGITVKDSEYPLIPDIPPSEVRSFELIKRAKIFYNTFREAFPSQNDFSYKVPKQGSIIAIYTYAGRGLAGTSRAPGLSKMSIPVFAPVREFYSPNYEKLSSQDWAKPDHRALIHWSPRVSTDDSGKATISFYNADVTGDVMVVVEAITDHGRIGYQEMVYGVKKK